MEWINLVSLLVFSNPSALHVAVFHLPSKITYLFSNIYGPQDVHERVHLLSDCRNLATQFIGPWFIGGDFNTTRIPEERNSGNISHDTEFFNSFIFGYSLIDPPISNRFFTWFSHRSAPSLAKLDKFLCNVAWEDQHPLTLVHGLATTLSDHCPIMLNFSVL